MTSYLRRSGFDLGRYINPDEIAAGLPGSDASRSPLAQEIAEREWEVCLIKKQDMSFETVMSHPSKIHFRRRARAAGDHVTLFFVCLSDVRLNLARVEARVMFGGRDVLADKVEARCQRGLNFLFKAVVNSHRTVVFNSSEFGQTGDGLRPLCTVYTRRSGIELVLQGKIPEWAEAHLIRPLDELNNDFRNRHGVDVVRAGRQQ